MARTASDVVAEFNLAAKRSWREMQQNLEGAAPVIVVAWRVREGFKVQIGCATNEGFREDATVAERAAVDEYLRQLALIVGDVWMRKTGMQREVQ